MRWTRAVAPPLEHTGKDDGSFRLQRYVHVLCLLWIRTSAASVAELPWNCGGIDRGGMAVVKKDWIDWLIAAELTAFE